jgi:hypothetical protein
VEVEKAGQLPRGVADPSDHPGVDQASVQEILVAGVDRGRDRERGEEAEQRAKGVLDDERMARPAAGRGQDDGLAGERLGLDEVEQVLEQARIGALVDGRTDDERVRRLDRIDDAGGGKRQIGSGVGRAETRPGVEEVVGAQVAASVVRISSASRALAASRASGVRSSSDIRNLAQAERSLVLKPFCPASIALSIVAAWVTTGRKNAGSSC